MSFNQKSSLGGTTQETWLSAYLRNLQTHPLRTKSLTSASLNAVMEVSASYLAGEKSANGSYVSDRVPKMALYGLLISGPLQHFLVSALQKAFEGKTGPRDKLLQILASNLINAVYLSAMAIVAGARTIDQVRATVKAGFWTVMRVSWATSPISIAIAQKFIPPHAWVPFFNMIAFVIGTYINATTKRRRRAALKKQNEERAKGFVDR